MNKKCIAVVSSYYGPYAGNFVASLEGFNRVMKSRAYRVIFVFHGDADKYEWLSEFKENKDAVYLVPYKPYSLDNVKRLRKIFACEKVDLVYSRLGGWEITSHFADRHIPCVWHFEFGLQLTSFTQKMKYWFKYRILGNKNVYHIAISKSGSNTINELGVKNKCVFIPNAPELSRLRPVQPYKKDEIELINVLIFAYDPYTKGLDVAVDSIEKLNNNRVRLLVVAQEKTLEYLSKRFSSIPEWIKLLQPTDDIASIYKQAHIMLSASRSEGFSYCLMEALYSGLPVVYSDIPGTSWVDNGFKMAYKFRSEDSLSLISALNEAITQKCEFENQEYNRRFIEENYSMNSWSNRVCDEIEKILLGEK